MGTVPLAKANCGPAELSVPLKSSLSQKEYGWVDDS